LHAAVPLCKILLASDCSEMDVMYRIVERFAITLSLK
jgi:hypothetical protein